MKKLLTFALSLCLLLSLSAPAFAAEAGPTNEALTIATVDKVSCPAEEDYPPVVEEPPIEIIYEEDSTLPNTPAFIDDSGAGGPGCSDEWQYWNRAPYGVVYIHSYDYEEGWECWEMQDLTDFLAANPTLKMIAEDHFPNTYLEVTIDEDCYAAYFEAADGRTLTVLNWHCNSDLRPRTDFQVLYMIDPDLDGIAVVVYAEESRYIIDYGRDMIEFWTCRQQLQEACEYLGFDSGSRFFGFVSGFIVHGGLISSIVA